MKNLLFTALVLASISIASIQSIAQIIVCSHPYGVDAIAFINGSKILLTTSSTFMYKWDVSNLKLIDTVFCDYTGKIASNPENNHFITGSFYPELVSDVKLWNMNERKPLKNLDDGCPFEIAGDNIYLAKSHKKITIENILTNSVIDKDWGTWDKKYISNLVTSRNKEYLAIVGQQDLGDFDYIYHFEVRNMKTGEVFSSYAQTKSADFKWVDVSALSSTGEYFAWTYENMVYLFSVKPAKLLAKFKCNQKVKSMDFSIDDRFLAVGEENSYYAIFNIEKGNLQVEKTVANFNNMDQQYMKGSSVNIIQGDIELFPLRNKANQWIYDIKFSDDGKYLGFACSKYVIFCEVEKILK